VVLEKKGIEGENAFFQIWLFFWLLTQNMIMTNDHSPFAEIKKHFFFFRLFFWKNISTKWRCPDRPFCDYFSEEKPTTLWSMKKKSFVQNNSKDAQLQILCCFFDKSFLFWTNEKKNEPISGNSPPLDNVDAKTNVFLIIINFFLFL